MKKFVCLALVLLVATANCAIAGKKKDKKNPAATTQTVVLKTKADSLSYAAGVGATMGLEQYLEKQLHLDSTQRADFTAAFEEALTKMNDKKFQALAAGYQIAQTASQAILPNYQKNLKEADITINDSLFYKGFAAGFNNDTTYFKPANAMKLVRETTQAAERQANEKWKEENTEWLAKNAKKQGVQTTPSGLQYKVIKMGTGEKPTATDTVVVKYEGKDINGEVFDSSYKRNPQTINFVCNQVIKGWNEALEMMPAGSKWELYIPENLAYGARKTGPIKAFSTLIFTVELEAVKKAAPKAATTAATKAKVSSAKKANHRKRR